MATSQARSFSSVLSNPVSRMTLSDGAVMMGQVMVVWRVVCTAWWLPLLSWPTGMTRSQLARAQPHERGRFLAQGGNQRSSERETQAPRPRETGSRQKAHGRGSPEGVDHRRCKAVERGIGAEFLDLLGVASGLSRV